MEGIIRTKVEDLKMRSGIGPLLVPCFAGGGWCFLGNCETMIK